MNVYTHADVAGMMTAEIGYTGIMTTISTAMSVALIAFGSWTASAIVGKFVEAGSQSAAAQALYTLTKGITLTSIAKGVIRGVVEESYEEIVLDGLIEAVIENAIETDFGFWLSSLLTSIRETASGTAQRNRGQQLQLSRVDQLLSMQLAPEVVATLSAQQRAEIFSEYKISQELLKSQEATDKNTFKKLLMSNVFKILTLGTSSFFMGGFTLLGTIQVAKNLGGKIIHTPQAISNFRTELQKTKKSTPMETCCQANRIKSQ